jgi:hypothetical protein
MKEVPFLRRGTTSIVGLWSDEGIDADRYRSFIAFCIGGSEQERGPARELLAKWSSNTKVVGKMPPTAIPMKRRHLDCKC